MNSDRVIGRVVKVKTYQALVELLPDTSSYVKSSYGGLYAIATINSYVILPIGSERVVAIVTSLDMAEEAEATLQNRQMLILPNARRTMWITMVGTITQVTGSSEKRFDFGIRRYPELDNPVWFASEEDLDVIFEKNCPDPQKAKRLISIGKSPLFPDYDVQIDMDSFFGKHAAVLGNTGSGKSCTVTAIINAVMKAPKGNGMPHAHFIIFDTNAEYESAFTIYNESEPSKYLYNRLIIKNDGDTPSGFWVPHWFMNGADYTAFFRPGEGAQGPLLYRALEKARSKSQVESFKLMLLNTIEDSINGIDGMLNNPPSGNAGYHGKKNLREMIQSLSKVISDQQEVFQSIGLENSGAKYQSILSQMEVAVAADGRIIAETSAEIRPIIEELRRQLANDYEQITPQSNSFVGVDSPVYFNFSKFVTQDIREELAIEARNNPNLRNWVGTLLLRLEQAKQDPRYSFLFHVNKFSDSLASFLRLIFGVDPLINASNVDSKPPWFDEYSKQYSNNRELHQITILDFSQLASDVLENITALIGRLILEFMQRCPDRGKYPVVLVLEEAHHYIPAHATLERQQRAREVFERIAKEGRKYGLSLLVASQRPSELSPTVLAQCNSFVVHRIQNPDDREYFKSVISGINKDLLEQLPALPQQHALIIGDCITIPLQVRINDVNPKPHSHDPEFFKIWSNPKSTSPDFESIASKWEGSRKS